jgi:tetratricopeptide (TPR) repeat protein
MPAWASHEAPQKIEVSNEKESRAIDLYNQSMEPLINGKTVEAESLLHQAADLYPNMNLIQTRWGMALIKLGKIDEALSQLVPASRSPDASAATWLNLGMAYEAKGDYPLAIASINKYLALEPAGEDSTRMKAYVGILLKEQQKHGTGSANANNYLAEATQQRILRWPKDRMPLKIFITPGEQVPGYKPSFEPIVKKSISDWADASGNRIAFVYETKPESADIVIRFTNDTKEEHNLAEGGHARIVSNDKGLTHIDVILLTRDPNEENKLTENGFGWVAYHELGHSLGLIGHSAQRTDIMCFSAPMNDEPVRPSQRDHKYNSIVVQRRALDC